MKYKEAIAKREHLIALGQNEILVFDADAEDFPYHLVSDVRAGSAYRLNGPASCWLIAHDQELTFQLNVEFEERGANGSAIHQFDGPRLISVMARLKPAARAKFADVLENEVLPAVTKVTNDWLSCLQKQRKSHQVVMDLIYEGRLP